MPAHAEGYLGNLTDLVGTPAALDGLGELEHGLLPHPVAEVVRRAPLKNRRQQFVFPIVVVREPAQRCLDSPDHDRHVRIEFFQDPGIYADGIIRPGAGLPFGGVGVVVAQALAGGVVVDHGVHGPGIDGEI